MKKLTMIISLLFLSVSFYKAFSQGTGYVTLKGKQFYDVNGDPFFPTICNLQVSAYHDPTAAIPYFLNSRNLINGITLDEELAEIKSLHFNAIRLCVEDGLGPEVVHDDINNVVTGLDFKFYRLPNFNYDYINLQPGNTNRPYSDDPNLNTILSLYQPVLDTAAMHGLKVIILAGGVHAFDHLPQSLDHIAYFQSRLAEYFSTNSTILAWDLHNEPGMQFSDAYGSPLPPVPTKRWVCENVAKLYDSFHDYDPNHLITIGNGAIGPSDILSFDPNILKIDFLSTHVYPLSNAGNPVDPDKQVAHILSEMYWLNEECNKPYIIGETGFRSNSNIPNLVNGLDGTVTEAGAFLHNVLQHCADCGFSGFSWWNFQNKSNDPLQWQNPGDVSWGILDYDPAMPNPLSLFRKPALANELAAFNEGQNMSPNSCVKPVDYYQPDHYPDNHQNTIIIHGTVVDLNNQPIKNAIVFGWSVTHPDASNINVTGDSFSKTITDSNGNFELRPDPGAFNGQPDPNDNDAPPLEFNHSIAISAAGCDLERKGAWYGGSIIDHATYPLIKYSLKYDENINGINIQNQRNDFNAWNNLVVHDFNVTQNGETDLTARYEITLTEFFSERGTESHIFTSTVFPDCEETTDNKYKIRSKTSILNNENETTKEIILRFYTEKNVFFHVWPNPTNGLVGVDYYETEKFSECKFRMFDLLGKLIKSGNIEAGKNSIDISSKIPGIYVLELFNKSIKQQYKIVKQ